MYVTIRSYDSCEKADYIRYRLERAGIESKIVAHEGAIQESEKSIHIAVLSDQVEKAVEELLKTHSEYPNENFELRTDPKNLLHILVPIDFSEKSFEAFKYAIDIANNRPVEIKFLHVWNDELDDSIAVRSSYAVEDFKRMQRNELKRDIDSNLEKYKAKLNKYISDNNLDNKLLYHFAVTEGIVAKQIEKTVYRYKPQLVIFAHNTDNEYKFRMSRKVANHIIGLAYCPVFYIPEKSFYSPFKELHIMYATNFDKNDLQSFNALQELSTGYKTHIYCMHVQQEASDTNAHELMESLIQQMEKSKSKELSISSDILSGSKLLNSFDSYIKENGIDMISFTSPEYGVWHKLFNPDNLRSMLKGSTIPLLIFRYK